MGWIMQRVRAWASAPALPYERDGKHSIPRGEVWRLCVALGFLALLEIAAFVLGGVFAVLAAYLWVGLGVFCFGFLGWQYIRAVGEDLRRGALWGLLPLITAFPVCFFYLDNFSFLNSEPLSELQHAYEVSRRTDLGYTEVFWFSYPSRSLLINLLPTEFLGIGMFQMRVGFSLPLFCGILFFFAGLRRYHGGTRLASAVAGIVTAAIFAFPMMCKISRSFEMAISSVSFGLWAIGAMFLFASRPNVVTALVSSWTIGLLAASFTSGLALVALLYALLAVWLLRAFLRGDSGVSGLVAAVLCNSLVVGVCLFSSRVRPLRPRQIPFESMLDAFWKALSHVVEFRELVFIPGELLIPLALGVLFALTVRGGLLPLILTAWCFPVVWGAANLHGKTGPQLPFALYRALLIVPVLLYVFGRLLIFLLEKVEKQRWLTGAICIALAASLYYPFRSVQLVCPVLQPPRPPEGREITVIEILGFLPSVGLTPYSQAVVVDRTDEKKVENFLASLNYFLPAWTRVPREEPLPFTGQGEKRSGLIVATPDSPVIAQTFPGYTRTDYPKHLVFDRLHSAEVIFIVLTPQ